MRRSSITWKKSAAGVVALFSIVVSTAALADDPISTGLFNDVAVSGFDTVAYFTQGSPVEGSKQHTSEYMDAEFRFASAENKASFDADPSHYAPQYGGYCAWAVSQGYTAKADPEQWKIVDDKLYLNYNSEIRVKWEQDIPTNIGSADENWPSLTD
jgi:YHS domain-containing protein